MFRVISLLCFTFGIFISVESKENCDALGTLIYEDLGCRSVKKNAEGCSIQYECDDFTQKDDSCLFRGKTYGLNESINDELIYPFCDVDCSCKKSKGTPEFTCAELDCPEWDDPIAPGCYRKFELDKCCSVGISCSSVNNTLAKCSVDGKQYREGEEIYPKNTCFKCVCGKDWKGNFESPFCERNLCNSQLRKAKELHDKCAPVYFSKEALCCPDTWVCPSPSDHITKINNNVDSNSELSCVFGSKTVKLGEGFQTKASHYDRVKNVQCECAVPPLLTCKEV